ncbi:hypothetical protein C8R45DRAFT_1109287 [Mycena sanguinolenta]|nr:hypothetical protein C8R45DRAFT_1109287 [Mycena sanguinolenta]
MARMGRIRPSAHATRNPGKRVQLSRCRLGVSGAERTNAAIKVLESRQRKAQYHEDVDAFFSFRAAEITRIAKTHGKSERVVRNLLCHKTQYKTERKKTLRNAILHDHALKAKESGECKRLADYQEELHEEFEDGIANVTRESLGEEEYNRLMDQLEEHRQKKKRGTAFRMGEEMIDLHERTGVRVCALFSRGNGDDPALPHFVEAGSGMSFFPDELKISAVEALRRFERFACTFDNAGQEKNDINAVHSCVAKATQDGLREIKNNSALHMEYVNYDSAIRVEHSVELKGWPSDIPIEHAANMNVESARRIRDGFKSGAIHWAWIPTADRDTLIARLNAERAAANGSLCKRAERSDKGVARGPRKPAAAARTPSTASQAASTFAPGRGSALDNPAAVPTAAAVPVAAVPDNVAAPQNVTTSVATAVPSQPPTVGVDAALSLPEYTFDASLLVPIDLDGGDEQTPDDGPVGIRLPPPPTSPARPPLASSSTANATSSMHPSDAAAGGVSLPPKKHKARKDLGKKRGSRENQELQVVQAKKVRKKRSDAGRARGPRTRT